MKCPFCAEEIQNDAILCRYCHSYKSESEWISLHDRAFKSATKSATKSDCTVSYFAKFTIVSTAILILVSGLSEIFSLSTAVPLFGALRTGFLAVLYHLFFAGLFIVSGGGLLAKRVWSINLLFVVTGIYTIDRLLFLADPGARAAYIQQQLPSPEMMQLISASDLESLASSVTLVTLVSWWSFTTYVYWQREYFECN